MMKQIPMAGNTATRDRTLRYLHLGLTTEELLSCFAPKQELIQGVYDNRFQLKQDVEQPLFSNDSVFAQTEFQDMMLTLVPRDQSQARDAALKAASENTRRQVRDEILLFKSLILIESDTRPQSIHALIRRFKILEFGIRKIYHGHPRYLLETLQMFAVLPKTPAADLLSFLQSNLICVAVLDPDSIPARFGPQPQPLLEVPIVS